MEKQMNKRLKFGLIIVILVAVAVFAAFWALVLRQQQIPAFEQIRGPPPRSIPGDFQYFYVANTIISTINIALLAILALIYFNIYQNAFPIHNRTHNFCFSLPSTKRDIKSLYNIAIRI